MCDRIVAVIFNNIATAKVVRTQTEDKTVEIQAFQGLPPPPAPCSLPPTPCSLLYILTA